jgi:broad specificity phosphatase PhoE
LLLVRHSLPEREPDVPSEDWSLSEEGRRRCGPLASELAAFDPTVLLSSPEAKAYETAELVAPTLELDLQVSDGLRETERRGVGWLERDELRRRIHELFERPEDVVFGEESAGAALRRFQAAVEGLPEQAVVVSHGTVISLYVAARTGEDPWEVWQALDFPDVVEV